MDWNGFAKGAKNTAKFGMIGSPIYDSLFGGDDEDPSEEANKYLNQIPGTVKPYYQGSIDAGNNAMPKVQAQFDKLMSDPAAMMKQFGSGYQESPGFQFQKNQGMEAINNAMASGGMNGSPQHGYMAGEAANNFANQDFNKYLEHVMGLYGTGLSGQQDIMHQGVQSSQELAQLLGGNLAAQGGLAYAGAANKNQQKTARSEALYKGLGTAASMMV